MNEQTVDHKRDCNQCASVEVGGNSRPHDEVFKLLKKGEIKMSLKIADELTSEITKKCLEFIRDKVIENFENDKINLHEFHSILHTIARHIYGDILCLLSKTSEVPVLEIHEISDIECYLKSFYAEREKNENRN